MNTLKIVLIHIKIYQNRHRFKTEMQFHAFSLVGTRAVRSPSGTVTGPHRMTSLTAHHLLFLAHGRIGPPKARVAELADAQDLKSCEGFPREGSTPSPGTMYIQSLVGIGSFL